MQPGPSTKPAVYTAGLRIINIMVHMFNSQRYKRQSKHLHTWNLAPHRWHTLNPLQHVRQIWKSSIRHALGTLTAAVLASQRPPTRKLVSSTFPVWNEIRQMWFPQTIVKPLPFLYFFSLSQVLDVLLHLCPLQTFYMNQQFPVGTKHSGTLFSLRPFPPSSLSFLCVHHVE